MSRGLSLEEGVEEEEVEVAEGEEEEEEGEEVLLGRCNVSMNNSRVSSTTEGVACKKIKRRGERIFGVTEEEGVTEAEFV